MKRVGWSDKCNLGSYIKRVEGQSFERTLKRIGRIGGIIVVEARRCDKVGLGEVENVLLK